MTHRYRAAVAATVLACLGNLVLAAPAQAQTSAPSGNDYADPASWLCLPGRDDACAVDLTATVLHADGRGVVLIGHSQGAGVLTQLIRNEIEGRPVAAQLVSALIIGSNVAVAKDADAGGAFQTVPLCREPSQTGCVVAYVSFRDQIPPPPGSRFGRAAEDGQEAACTHPASLVGGRAPLDAYLASGSTGIATENEAAGPQWLKSGEKITTPFVRAPGLLEAECVRDGGFHYLSVRTVGDADGPRTNRISGDVVGPQGQIAADWGLHLIDMHLAMGDLVALVGQQAQAWSAKPR
jgi:hypothetical protein